MKELPKEKSNLISHCPLCGYGPWVTTYKSIDELRMSYDICECCGGEFGNDDSVEYYDQWVNEGCKWFDEKFKPKGWDLKDQLKFQIRPWSFPM